MKTKVPRQHNYSNILKMLLGSDDFKVSAPFGEMAPPRTKPHDGVDFEMPEGTLIKMPEDGIITGEVYGINRTVSTAGSGIDFGNWTMFYIPLWNRTYLIAHTQYKASSVDKVGESYPSDKKITLSGNTGLSTGPHLHLGVAIGRYDSFNEFRKNAINFLVDIVAYEEEVEVPPEEKPDHSPIAGSVKESGVWTVKPYPEGGIRVRDFPNRESGNQVGRLTDGDKVTYDSYILTDGHSWVSWFDEKLGIRVYAACRTWGGRKGTLGKVWGHIV